MLYTHTHCCSCWSKHYTTPRERAARESERGRRFRRANVEEKGMRDDWI